MQIQREYRIPILKLTRDLINGFSIFFAEIPRNSWHVV